MKMTTRTPELRTSNPSDLSIVRVITPSTAAAAAATTDSEKPHSTSETQTLRIASSRHQFLCMCTDEQERQALSRRAGVVMNEREDRQQHAPQSSPRSPDRLFTQSQFSTNSSQTNTHLNPCRPFSCAPLLRLCKILRAALVVDRGG